MRAIANAEADGNALNGLFYRAMGLFGSLVRVQQRGSEVDGNALNGLFYRAMGLRGGFCGPPRRLRLVF